MPAQVSESGEHRLEATVLHRQFTDLFEERLAAFLAAREVRCRACYAALAEQQPWSEGKCYYLPALVAGK